MSRNLHTHYAAYALSFGLPQPLKRRAGRRLRAAPALTINRKGSSDQWLPPRLCFCSPERQL